MTTTLTRLRRCARATLILAPLHMVAMTAAGCMGSTPADETPVITSTARLYEWARLVPGHGGELIEDSAFLVDDDIIAAVGRKGGEVSLLAPHASIWMDRR